MKKELNKAYAALGLVSFFWGTTYIAARIGAQHMPGLFISGLRQFFSGLILVSFFAGILVIFYDYLGEVRNTTFVFGVVLALLSTLSWSFGTVYTSRKKPTIDILFGVGLQMLIAGVIILSICALSGKYVSLADTGHESWYALIYLIVFGSLIAYSAYVFAISKLPATLVSIYAYINPIVAVGLGWLLLSEKMHGHLLLGTFITLGGIYIINREYKKIKI